MNAKQIEVHNYFKAMHPEALIIYSSPQPIQMLGEDVERALKSITNLQIIENGVGIMPDDILCLSALGASGAEVHLVRYKNDDV